MTMAYCFPVMKDEFKDKRVWVTGGTKGMGETILRRFTSAPRRTWNDPSACTEKR